MSFAFYLLVSLEERSVDLCSLLLPSRQHEPQGLGGESRDPSPGSLLVWMEDHGVPCLHHILLLGRHEGVSWYIWLPALDWRAKDNDAFLFSLATGCRKGGVRSSTKRGNMGENRGPLIASWYGLVIRSARLGSAVSRFGTGNGLIALAMLAALMQADEASHCHKSWVSPVRSVVISPTLDVSEWFFQIMLD